MNIFLSWLRTLSKLYSSCARARVCAGTVALEFTKRKEVFFLKNTRSVLAVRETKPKIHVETPSEEHRIEFEKGRPLVLSALSFVLFFLFPFTVNVHGGFSTSTVPEWGADLPDHVRAFECILYCTVLDLNTRARRISAPIITLVVRRRSHEKLLLG